MSNDLTLRALEERVSVTVYDRTPAAQTVERAKGHAIVISNKVVLTREIVGELPDLKAVFLMSTGTNAVDLQACAERGIPVCNIPAYSTTSVAELVFAYILDWARGVAKHTASVRAGDWARSSDFCYTLTPQRELAGLTLGLIGFGDIAQHVAKIARGFEMNVLVTTPNPDGKPDLGQQFVPLKQLLNTSDLVSLHCPLNAETGRMMNEETFSWMKKGSVLINTSRGGLVDEPALVTALDSGSLHAAYLDVLSTEPPAASNPLPGAAGTHITPHLAWATRAARERLVEVLTANVVVWMEGGIQNQVNGA